jgi:hypothetical protein
MGFFECSSHTTLSYHLHAFNYLVVEAVVESDKAWRACSTRGAHDEEGANDLVACTARNSRGNDIVVVVDIVTIIRIATIDDIGVQEPARACVYLKEMFARKTGAVTRVTRRAKRKRDVAW